MVKKLDKQLVEIARLGAMAKSNLGDSPQPSKVSYM